LNLSFIIKYVCKIKNRFQNNTHEDVAAPDEFQHRPLYAQEAAE
jgi:hypothetical protein